MSDERDSAYDRIDHFLRNSLDDDNYAVYSGFLEQVYDAPHPAPIPEETCNWELTDDDWSYWESDFGIAFTLEDGKPSENDMAYCPKCGKKLVEFVKVAAARSGE